MHATNGRQALWFSGHAANTHNHRSLRFSVAFLQVVAKLTVSMAISHCHYPLPFLQVVAKLTVPTGQWPSLLGTVQLWSQVIAAESPRTPTPMAKLLPPSLLPLLVLPICTPAHILVPLPPSPPSPIASHPLPSAPSQSLSSPTPLPRGFHFLATQFAPILIDLLAPPLAPPAAPAPCCPPIASLAHCICIPAILS